MSFRKFGGLNYASTNNIVRSHYSNTDNSTISNTLGLLNSKIVSKSHLDLSGNSIINVGGIYFQNGTELIDGTYTGNLTVTGTLTVDQATYLHNSLNVSGDCLVNGSLGTTGDVNIGGAMDICGNIVMSGTPGTNYLDFPDGTKQYSAMNSLTPGSYTNTNITVNSYGSISAISSGPTNTNLTYTVIYSSSQIVPVPSNVAKFDAIIIGPGGKAGEAASGYGSGSEGDILYAYQGGSGGGGCIVTVNSIPWTSSNANNMEVIITPTITVGVGGSTVFILDGIDITFCPGGINGGNASGGDGSGMVGGGGPGALISSIITNQNYGSGWKYYGGTIGSNGVRYEQMGNPTLIPVGYPEYTAYSYGGAHGAGQSYGLQPNGDPTTSPYSGGAVIITWYVT